MQKLKMEAHFSKGNGVRCTGKSRRGAFVRFVCCCRVATTFAVLARNKMASCRVPPVQISVLFSTPVHFLKARRVTCKVWRKVHRLVSHLVTDIATLKIINKHTRPKNGCC